MRAYGVFPDEEIGCAVRGMRGAVRDRTSIVALKMCGDPNRRIIVFMSFHSKYKIPREEKQIYVDGFRAVVANIRELTGCTVAGADLNHEIEDVLPYELTSRRTRKIDYFILSTPPNDISVEAKVTAYDIEAQYDNFNPLPTFRPTSKATVDHDPLVCELTVSVRKIHRQQLSFVRGCISTVTLRRHDMYVDAKATVYDIYPSFIFSPTCTGEFCILDDPFACEPFVVKKRRRRLSFVRDCISILTLRRHGIHVEGKVTDYDIEARYDDYDPSLIFHLTCRGEFYNLDHDPLVCKQISVKMRCRRFAFVQPTYLCM